METGRKDTTDMEGGDQEVSRDSPLHDTSPKIEEPSMDDLKKTNENQRKELQQKDSEIKTLKDEIAALKQTEEELNRLLDSASLGGLSLDSGFLSDSRSMVSWTSTSTSASSLSLETQGATGGQVKGKRRLGNLLKRLHTCRRRKVAEKGIQAVTSVADKGVHAVTSAEDHTSCSQGRTSSLEKLSTITGNIEQPYVTVRTTPCNEDKKFMLDIAGKFERSGPTLLVMVTEEQVQEARNEKTCSFMLTIAEWQQKLDSGETLEGITNMVTNCAHCPFLPDLKGRCWKFLSGEDAVTVQVPEETDTKNPRILTCLISNEDKTTSLSLQCGQMEMDKNRGCHVTDDGCLVNTGPTQLSRPENMAFSKFRGTFSTTPIRILSNPTSQIPAQPCLYYFETETELHIDGSRQLRFATILEVGVIEEEELGNAEVSYGMPRSWCVRVGGCPSHNTKICIQIYNERECIKCFSLSVEAGNQVTRHTLRFGIVLDVGKGRICIIDLDSGEVLLKVDAEFKDNLYPVFGIYSTPNDATVKMILISGADIQIDENKEKLIHSCMT